MNTVPLFTLDQYSYSQAQEFSRLLDIKLGFKIQEVEAQIQGLFPHTPWAGLNPEALQTPYPEIRIILEKLSLNPGQTIIDLGAGYGRMGLVLAEFFPEVNFIGYEISPLRVQEGNRILNDRFPRVKLLEADMSLTHFKLPIADVYFIYDFGDLESIIRVIDQLKLIAKRRPIKLVGRGRRTRDQIERNEPWLSQVNPPKHCGNFSIYQS